MQTRIRSDLSGQRITGGETLVLWSGLQKTTLKPEDFANPDRSSEIASGKFDDAVNLFLGHVVRKACLQLLYDALPRDHQKGLLKALLEGKREMKFDALYRFFGGGDLANESAEQASLLATAFNVDG